MDHESKINRPNVSHDPAPDVWTIREQLINFAQTYSGNKWTDFNIHDPGVMLLEQIAYAITEIEYRASIDITARITGFDGQIDINTMRLAPPSTIMYMQPVTTADLESVLSGADASVARVTVVPKYGNEAGLYNLYVVPSSPEATEKARECVEQAYLKLRNLCEDADSVAAATARRCTLTLKLEHQRRARPEQIVADAFALCNALLTSKADSNTDITTNEAFNNPVLLASGCRTPNANTQLTTMLSKAVSELPGVVHVHELLLHDIGVNDTSDKTKIDHCDDSEYLALELPPDTDKIALSSRGRHTPVDLARVKDLLAQHLNSGNSVTSASPWLNFPEIDTKSPIGNYRLPISQELPASYQSHSAIFSNRITSNTGNNNKQFMNYISLIDAILDETEGGRHASTDLFSENLTTNQTYIDSDRTNLINQEKNNDVNALDPLSDRKSRVLDRILSMYGEHFTQFSLKHFCENKNPQEYEEQRLHNKRRLLRSLPSIEPRRGTRYGFEKKLKILLGLPDYDQTTLTHSLLDLELTFLFEEPKFVSVNIPANAIVPEPNLTITNSWPKDVFPNNTISEATLLSAANLSNYRIFERGSQWVLSLRLEEWDPQYRFIESYPAYIQAEEAANSLANGFTDCLNRAAKDVKPQFLIVEDILLRAAGTFEPMTLDIVFASGIDRDGMPGYRQFVAETVSMICPAHILPRLWWKTTPEFTALMHAMEFWSTEPSSDNAEAIRQFLHSDRS